LGGYAGEEERFRRNHPSDSGGPSGTYIPKRKRGTSLRTSARPEKQKRRRGRTVLIRGEESQWPEQKGSREASLAEIRKSVIPRMSLPLRTVAAGSEIEGEETTLT